MGGLASRMLNDQYQYVDPTAPPPLSDHYHHARKQYSLVSGILLAYVLVGIKLPDNGKIIPSAEVALKTPDALPLIFIALLAYFAYRLTIEWNQCHEQRCAFLASKIDFYVAHALGILAVAAYLIDRALQVGLGELAVTYAPEIIFVGFWLFLVYKPPCSSVPLWTNSAGLRVVRDSADGWIGWTPPCPRCSWRWCAC